MKLRNKIDELNGGPLAPPRPQGMVDAPVPMNPHVFIRAIRDVPAMRCRGDSFRC
ncbi:MAG: hypothetical protein WDN28_34005 [Chthoniobacter sp.]